MKSVTVLDSTMNYRETGDGANVVLLHGNPLPSHVWRNVMPALGQHARCLAPDLIGMGNSGRPAISYRFDDHARYLEAWMSALHLEDVTLVGYDWGGALAMDYAARHPKSVRGLAVFETFLRPMHWSDWPAPGAALFKNLRTPGVGEKLVLDDNVFLARSLENGVKSGLAPEDRDYYASLYHSREARVPMLIWPREIPIDGEPADVAGRIGAYGEWLQESSTPKLLMTFTHPSVIMPAKTVDWARRSIRALEVTDLPEAGHHAPEDRPAEIAAALIKWLADHALTVARPLR